jgi:hypothetical protein
MFLNKRHFEYNHKLPQNHFLTHLPKIKSSPRNPPNEVREKTRQDDAKILIIDEDANQIKIDFYMTTPYSFWRSVLTHTECLASLDVKILF